MDRYTYITKENENLRNAIHKAYGKKCFYCGEPISMYQLEIDHIIPENEERVPNTVEMASYLNELKDKGFIKDCIVNYLPCCKHCNNQKRNRYFTIGNMRYFHEQTERVSTDVIKRMKRFKYSNKDKTNEKYIREIWDNKEYFYKRTILKSFEHYIYANGLGEVRINAYFPIRLNEQMHCIILFRQSGLSDCIFSFDDKEIKTLLFTGYNTKIALSRGFISYINSERVGISFSNARFEVSYKTVEQLCNLIDDLYKEYYTKKDEILTTIGATYFDEVNYGGFLILKIPKDTWISMVDFAQTHSYHLGDTEWDIFNPLNLIEKNRIMIYKNHLNKINADILAELYVKNLNTNYVEVIWKSGFTHNLMELDGFDNIHKWKVDYTHDWLIDEFIPYIFYSNFKDKRAALSKKNSLENFKKSFNYSDYEIISLKLNN